jgi:hypothetical protein
MKAYREADVQKQIFLTSALLEDEWSDSRPGRFTPGERAPGTHWIGDWWTPKPVWTTWRRKPRDPTGAGINPQVVQPVASRYIDYAIPTPIYGEAYRL